MVLHHRTAVVIIGRLGPIRGLRGGKCPARSRNWEKIRSRAAPSEARGAGVSGWENGTPGGGREEQ
jgi:hypothetical protein